MKPLSKTDWLNKVPEVTLSFWIIKIMSTTVGETCADYLAVDAGLGQGVTSIGMALLLGLALFAQFRSRAYTPWIYWLSVVLVSIVGTQITDVLTDQLGISLYLSTALPPRRQATRVTAISAAKISAPRVKPSPSASVARSPAAVPRAKVQSTVAQ